MSVIFLPLDPTGTATANKVAVEPHTLVNRPVRMAVPEYGAFFADSLVVVDVLTNTTLTAQQYRAGQMLPDETAKYGKRICTVVLITDPAVSNSITIGYQALGAWNNYSKSQLNTELLSLGTGEENVDYSSILNLPALFSPVAPHLHHVSETYGTEYLQDGVARITSAAQVTEAPARGRVTDYIKNSLNGAVDHIAAATNNALALHVAQSDPHPQYAQKKDVTYALALVLRPRGITPANNTTAVKLETSFHASPYYSLYGVPQQLAQFHLAFSPDFSDIQVLKVVNGGAQDFQPTDLLQGSKTYYWRVRYQDSAGQWSNWSIGNMFTTVPPYPAAGTVLATYCKSNTTEQWQTVADGLNGTYERLVNAKSTACGYVPPPPAGTVLSTYCSGFTLHNIVADGNGGSSDIIKEYNSATCGYVPPPAAGTVLATYCKGYDKYERIANGDGTDHEQLIEQNSSYCGYVPPPSNPAAGTIIGYTCQGYDKYNKVADGNGGYTLAFAQSNATVCGYSPPAAGTVLGSYCSGYDLYRTYADGNGGSYNQLYQANSSTCGYTPPPSPSLAQPYWLSGGGAVITSNTGSASFSLSDMVVYNDPGNTVHYLQTEWAVYDNVGNQVYTNTSNNMSAPPTVPASQLQNGMSYTMYARYMTAAIGPSPWSAAISFSTNWATNPPAGTILSTYCQGYDKYQNVADGNGGYASQLIETNSSYCGYVDPFSPGIGSIPSQMYAYSGNTATCRVVLNGDGTWQTSTIGNGPVSGGGQSGRYLNGSASGFEVFVSTNITLGGASAVTVSTGNGYWADLSNGLILVVTDSNPTVAEVDASFSVSIRQAGNPGVNNGFGVSIVVNGGGYG